MLSLDHYVLRRHEDGWQLTKAVSHASGTEGHIQSENEAKAWGTSVLRTRLDIGPMVWKPGPATPGARAFYATW